MSTVSLRLPESLHERARERARREGISINQLIATALAEKISALDTLAYLEERASHGRGRRFSRPWVPSARPVEGDEPPEALRQKKGK